MSDIDIKGPEFANNKDNTFNTQVGQSATVQRDGVESELGGRANLALRNIGEDLNPLRKQGVNYMGSAALHIYQSEVLGQIFFITQTDTLQDVPEVTASKALENFKGDMMETYGKKRQLRRSGF